jgi:hypothetical protein
MIANVLQRIKTSSYKNKITCLKIQFYSTSINSLELLFSTASEMKPILSRTSYSGFPTVKTVIYHSYSSGRLLIAKTQVQPRVISYEIRVDEMVLEQICLSISSAFPY